MKKFNQHIIILNLIILTCSGCYDENMFNIEMDFDITHNYSFPVTTLKYGLNDILSDNDFLMLERYKTDSLYKIPDTIDQIFNKNYIDFEKDESFDFNSALQYDSISEFILQTTIKNYFPTEITLSILLKDSRNIELDFYIPETIIIPAADIDTNWFVINPGITNFDIPLDYLTTLELRKIARVSVTGEYYLVRPDTDFVIIGAENKVEIIVKSQFNVTHSMGDL